MSGPMSVSMRDVPRTHACSWDTEPRGTAPFGRPCGGCLCTRPWWCLCSGRRAWWPVWPPPRLVPACAASSCTGGQTDGQWAHTTVVVIVAERKDVEHIRGMILLHSQDQGENGTWIWSGWPVARFVSLTDSPYCSWVHLWPLRGCRLLGPGCWHCPSWSPGQRGHRWAGLLRGPMEGTEGYIRGWWFCSDRHCMALYIFHGPPEIQTTKW